jgi:hypothetical protein
MTQLPVVYFAPVLSYLVSYLSIVLDRVHFEHVPFIYVDICFQDPYFSKTSMQRSSVWGVFHTATSSTCCCLPYIYIFHRLSGNHSFFLHLSTQIHFDLRNFRLCNSIHDGPIVVKPSSNKFS